jgi:hypothetical protein
MVRVAICTVGAEGEDDVGTQVTKARCEEALEMGRIEGIERAVGEVEKGWGTSADRLARGLELIGAPCPQRYGEWFVAAGEMIITTLATGGAEDVHGRTSAGSEGEEAGKGVALVVGMGDNRE